MRNVFIFEPGLSQSKAIARRLKKVEGVNVRGVIMSPPPSYIRRRLHSIRFVSAYDYLVYSSEFDDWGRGEVIATGSKATKEMCERSDSLVAGEVAYNRANLRFYSKEKGYSIAEEYGWSVPDTWYSANSIPGDNEVVFVKPTTEDKEGVRGRAPARVARKLVAGGEYLAQEVISGQGVLGYGFISQEGAVLAEAAHHEVCSYPVEGGSAAVIQACDDDRFIDLCRGFVNYIEYTGWGLIEVIKSQHDGRYVFLELNPKMWASIEFSMRQDPRFCRLFLGVEERETPSDVMWFVDRSSAQSLNTVFQLWRDGREFSSFIESDSWYVCARRFVDCLV